MRLIDADKFIISLKDHIDKPMTAGLCATLVELAPTAYVIDNVHRNKEFKQLSEYTEAELLAELMRRQQNSA